MLVVLAIAASGCASPQMTFRHQPDDSDPPPRRVSLVTRPTLALPRRAGPLQALQRRVLRGLEQSGHFADVLEIDDDPADRPPVDYVLELDYELERRETLCSLLVRFPGGLLFLPRLLGLRWDLDLTARLRMAPPHGPPTAWTRHDRFGLTYRPEGLGLLANPDAASIAGELGNSIQGYDFGLRVAASVAQQIHTQQESDLLQSRIVRR
jgi:hypothetical protein